MRAGVPEAVGDGLGRSGGGARFAGQPPRRSRVQRGAERRPAGRQPRVARRSCRIGRCQQQFASRPLIHPDFRPGGAEQLAHLTADVAERSGFAGFIHGGERFQGRGESALQRDFSPQSRAFERERKDGDRGFDRRLARVEGSRSSSPARRISTRACGTERERKGVACPESAGADRPVAGQIDQADGGVAGRQTSDQRLALRIREPAAAGEVVESGTGRRDEAFQSALSLQNHRDTTCCRFQQLRVQVGQEVREPVGLGQEANRSGGGRLRHTRADSTLAGLLGRGRSLQ